MPDVHESITVQARPADVYALVADLPRMSEWSPECTGVTWTGRPRHAVPGARFIGHNRAGVARWHTQGRILVAEPGRELRFRIHFGPLQVAEWKYEFRAVDAEGVDGDDAASGCVVTESWTDYRPRLLRQVMNRLMGDRRDLNAQGIRTTLTRLKAAAEAIPA
ncbi:polyketide cyclase/dehydrase/lipid transport protein [Kribbella amoyensis]|uniref:Polyketide cyclase/dehydrase/lipid transport protein n=1 Tax=Kribbella amoyensis TaxID=996641 RepID=A0A561BVM4_9ACTN|nr:SRPBCC family protein [Kribbella amoyensis]TWD82873.1 polyketide cyclase/dehydrase/lipid transport protein [Kribbella amoyensis]